MARVKVRAVTRVKFRAVARIKVWVVPRIKGGLYLKPLKFEHIFVAVITFPPFLLYRYF